jgi:hypothetical protein
MKTSEENYNELINILNSIFVIQFNKNTNHKEITINPNLNMEKLNEIIKNTRSIIIKLYINCEEDFVKGIEIYTAIAEKQNFDNSKRQLHNLNKNINKLIPQDNINPVKPQDNINPVKPQDNINPVKPQDNINPVKPPQFSQVEHSLRPDLIQEKPFLVNEQPLLVKEQPLLEKKPLE